MYINYYGVLLQQGVVTDEHTLYGYLFVKDLQKLENIVPLFCIRLHRKPSKGEHNLRQKVKVMKGEINISLSIVVLHVDTL